MNYLAAAPWWKLLTPKSKNVHNEKMNEHVKFFEINQIYWIFEKKNKLIPTANSITNIKTSEFVPQFSDGLGGVIGQPRILKL